jgi:uncharacterized coiled-coil DUF342 family protein
MLPNIPLKKANIKELCGHINELCNHINELRGNINELRGNINELCGNINELKANIKELCGNLKELKANIKGKKDILNYRTAWKSLPDSRSKYEITELEQGKKYWFRVAAVGGYNQIVFSQEVAQYVMQRDISSAA